MDKWCFNSISCAKIMDSDVLYRGVYIYIFIQRNIVMMLIW